MGSLLIGLFSEPDFFGTEAKAGLFHDGGLGLLGEQAGLIPACLERDFNFPPLQDLLSEVQQLRNKQEAALLHHARMQA